MFLYRHTDQLRSDLRHSSDACVSFDLIFANAIPGKYEHLDETLALLRCGGLYVVDDMLPQPTWQKDHAPRATGVLVLTRR